MATNQFKKFFAEKSSKELLEIFIRHRRNPYLDPDAYSALLDNLLLRKYSPAEKEWIDKALNEDEEALEQLTEAWEAMGEESENPLITAGTSLTGIAVLVWTYFLGTLLLGIAWAIVQYLTEDGPGYMEAGLRVTKTVLIILWVLLQLVSMAMLYRKLHRAGNALKEAGGFKVPH